MCTLKKISINNQTAQFTLLDKASRRKEKIKLEKGRKKQKIGKKIEKINKTKSWFLEEIYIIDNVWLD